MEGTRPLCVEVQALVAPTGAPIPRRVAQAFEGNRLAMLVAVLQQRAGIALADHDVYASVAGGVRVAEPGADLAVALAIAGARDDCAVDADTVVVGELGLGGEVRQVPQTPRRLAEALRLGFRRAIVPASTPDVRGMTLRRVGDLAPRRWVAAVLRRGVASGAGSDREDPLAQRRSEVLYAALRLVAPGHPAAGGHRPHPAGEDGRAHRRRRRARRC